MCCHSNAAIQRPGVVVLTLKVFNSIHELKHKRVYKLMNTSHSEKQEKGNLLKQQFMKTLPKVIRIGANLNGVEPREGANQKGNVTIHFAPFP